MQGTTQENYFPKPLTGKKERFTIPQVFYKHWSTESEFSDVCDSQDHAWGAELCSGGASAWRPRSQQPEHPQGHTGRSSSPGVHLVEVILSLHQQRTLWAPLSCPAYQYSNKDSSLIDLGVLNSTTK